MGERQQATTGGGSDGRNDREEEARRILDRLEQESAGVEGYVRRRAGQAAKHLSAQDADPDDKIELWATRIGRLLGMILSLAIIVWLVLYLFNH